MHDESEQTTLKLKLTEGGVRQFKSRAAALKVSRDEYAAAALHFALQDDGCIDESRTPVSGGPDVYVSLRGPVWLRETLATRGDRSGCNVASFSGMVMGQFFERHERDPRELIVLYHVDAAMRGQEPGRLPGEAFDRILDRCGPRLLTGVAPGFMANWFFNRFRSRIQEIVLANDSVSFSPQWLKERFGSLEAAE